MTKKEYIEKLKNLIVNRVKFHAPKLVDDRVDFDLLAVVGIDRQLPIFKFDKPLDKIFYHAFFEAKKEVPFNLILTEEPLVGEKKVKGLANTFVMFEAEMGSSLLASIEKLNINYRSNTSFKSEIEEDYMKINDRKIELEYIPYYLHKKGSDNNIIFEIKEFLLNGKNFLLSFTNPYKSKKSVRFEINVTLPKGYYFFKNDGNAVEIESLTSGDKAYFNYNLKGAKFSFSCIGGLESSTHACINLSFQTELLPLEQKRFYFNYGENKYLFLSAKQAKDFFDLSQNKMDEIFDIKINSKNKKFDGIFNRYLPQKIWLSWLKNDIDEESENFYLKTKQSLLKKVDGGVQINEEIEGLKEVRFFRNSGWKRVFIVPSESRYLFADKTKYFNFTLLTNEIFAKNNEIYLSFGH